MKGVDSLVGTIVDAVCKSLGISTAEIQAHFETLKQRIPEYAQRAMELLNRNDARLSALEQQNQMLIAQNVAILEAIHHIQGDILPAGSGVATAPAFINGAAKQE